MLVDQLIEMIEETGDLLVWVPLCLGLAAGVRLEEVCQRYLLFSAGVNGSHHLLDLLEAGSLEVSLDRGFHGINGRGTRRGKGRAPSARAIPVADHHDAQSPQVDQEQGENGRGIEKNHQQPVDNPFAGNEAEKINQVGGDGNEVERPKHQVPEPMVQDTITCDIDHDNKDDRAKDQILVIDHTIHLSF